MVSSCHCKIMKEIVELVRSTQFKWYFWIWVYAKNFCSCASLDQITVSAVLPGISWLHHGILAESCLVERLTIQFSPCEEMRQVMPFTRWAVAPFSTTGHSKAYVGDIILLITFSWISLSLWIRQRSMWHRSNCDGVVPGT